MYRKLLIFIAVILLPACYSNDLAPKNVKQVHSKTKNLVDKLVKKNDIVFYLSFSYSNYNVVWVHREGYVEAYDIFATKTIMYKIKETEAFNLKINRNFQSLDFSISPDGEFVGFATMEDNGTVKGYSIPIDYVEFIRRDYPERAYLENQIKKDLTLISNTRKLAEH